MDHEGSIKFECFWEKTGPVIGDRELREMNAWRDILVDLNLIGAYTDGVGYGNISVRSGSDGLFIITGSGTGKQKQLKRQGYSLITSYSLSQNNLHCKGPVIASSESLSHAAIYETDPEVNAVIHVHHADYWKELLKACFQKTSSAERCMRS